MLIDAKTIQALAWRAAAQQRQAEQFSAYQRQGNMEAAHFIELPAQQQATAYAHQAIADATDAANVGDVNGLRQGIRTAVEKVVYEGAVLTNPRRDRPLPRRKRGR